MSDGRVRAAGPAPGQSMTRPLLFAFAGERGVRPARRGGAASTLSPLEEREFEGGEHKTRPLVSVRGEDVYVVQSLSGDAAASANDRLCRLLFFIAGVKDSGAARVTACVPFLAYGRKDRRTKERDPVTLRYVAQLFEAVGTDHLLGARRAQPRRLRERVPLPGRSPRGGAADGRPPCGPARRHAGLDRVARHRRREARAAAAGTARGAARSRGRASRSSTSGAAAAWCRAATSSSGPSRGGMRCWWTT